MGTTILLGAIGAFGLQYWWAFLIIWLLWIIVAHIPNGPDHHYLDIYIPIICIMGCSVDFRLVEYRFLIEFKTYNLSLKNYTYFSTNKTTKKLNYEN